MKLFDFTLTQEISSLLPLQAVRDRRGDVLEECVTELVGRETCCCYGFLFDHWLKGGEDLEW